MRIAEKDLAEAERLAREAQTTATYSARGASEVILHLVAEVRRLRSLVRRVACPYIGEPGLEVDCPTDTGLCWWCGDDYGNPRKPHEPGCPWPDIEAEAKAE